MLTQFIYRDVWEQSKLLTLPATMAVAYAMASSGMFSSFVAHTVLMCSIRLEHFLDHAGSACVPKQSGLELGFVQPDLVECNHRHFLLKLDPFNYPGYG